MTALLKELREVFALSAKNFKDLLTQATEAGLEQVCQFQCCATRFLFMLLKSDADARLHKYSLFLSCFHLLNFLYLRLYYFSNR